MQQKGADDYVDSHPLLTSGKKQMMEREIKNNVFLRYLPHIFQKRGKNQQYNYNTKNKKGAKKGENT